MKKRIISLCLSALILLSTLALFASCRPNVPSVPDDTTTGAVADDTTTAPVDDPSPLLKSLKLDDGTDIKFDPKTTSYTVSLPAGRPRIPRISAEAEDEGAKLTVYQAFFPDTTTEASARVELTLDGKTSFYEIVFKKDSSRGFELQYDDRYTYTPSYKVAEGETLTFKSSDEKVVKIDENGVMTVLAVSADPVTITALVGEDVKETLTINRTVRAQVNVFIMAGQSNAGGTYDSGLPADIGTDAILKTRPGIAYCMETGGRFYDMNEGRKGFAGALCERWYELTGEKSVAIQIAASGAPIQTWEKGGAHFEGASSLYDKAVQHYQRFSSKYAGNKKDFEIVRSAYFWCQGETAQASEWVNGNWSNSNPYIMTADDYYKRYMAIHEQFVKDMDIEFGAILLVRALAKVSSAQNKTDGYLTDIVPVRAAQYTIHNTTDSSILIASRIGEIARPASAPDKTSPGYSYMGPANLHYSQVGYNAAGRDLAENAFASISANADRKVTSIDVLAPDGRTRLENGASVTVDKAQGYQLAAIALPLYAEMSGLTFEITEGADICSIDKYGKITCTESAKTGDGAKLTISSESGIKHTINIVVG
jgi:phage baseplate assembly protein gpV